MPGPLFGHLSCFLPYFCQKWYEGWLSERERERKRERERERERERGGEREKEGKKIRRERGERG